MIRRAHLRRAALLTALQLAGSVGLSSTLVLCSADGHVAVESALADECCRRIALPETGPALEQSPACDGCIDTPFTVSAVQRDRASERAGLSRASHAVRVVPDPGLALAASAPGVSAALRAIAASGALGTRRSVVLLV